MLEVIEKRISRRSFEKQNLDSDEIVKINVYIDELNIISNLTMEFMEDGSNAFLSLTKSYGIFSNVRSVILMKGKNSDVNLKEKIGYYGEELVLKLTKLNLGTCWVGGTFDKDKFKILDNESLICVIVVGKVRGLTLKEKMIRSVASGKRKSLNERLVSDINKLPEWLIEGIEAVRLAPSARNSQKVIFEYIEGNLSSKVPDNYEFDLVDLGIAKKHFEIVTNGSFAFGNGGIFNLN